MKFNIKTFAKELFAVLIAVLLCAALDQFSTLLFAGGSFTVAGAIIALAQDTDDAQNSGGILSIYVCDKSDIVAVPTVAAGVVTVCALDTGKFWRQIAPSDWTAFAKDEVIGSGKNKPSNKTTAGWVTDSDTTAQRLFAETCRKSNGVIFAITRVNSTKVLYGWDEKIGTMAALYYVAGGGDSGTKAEDSNMRKFEFSGEQVQTPLSFSFATPTS